MAKKRSIEPKRISVKTDTERELEKKRPKIIVSLKKKWGMIAILMIMMMNLMKPMIIMNMKKMEKAKRITKMKRVRLFKVEANIKTEIRISEWS